MRRTGCILRLSGSASPPDEPARPPLPRVAIAVSTPTVLLVDAHEDSLVIYAAALGHHGYRVVSSACCDEAPALARANLPQLIVMAVPLPSTPAWNAVREIKSGPATAQIPVLAISTTGMPEHRTLALQLGCAAFLVKPLPPLELLAAARTVLSRS